MVSWKATLEKLFLRLIIAFKPLLGTLIHILVLSDTPVMRLVHLAALIEAWYSDLAFMEDEVTQRGRQFGTVFRLDFPSFVVLGVFPAPVKLIYLLLALALYLKKVHIDGKTRLSGWGLAKLAFMLHIYPHFFDLDEMLQSQWMHQSNWVRINQIKGLCRVRIIGFQISKNQRISIFTEHHQLKMKRGLTRFNLHGSWNLLEGQINRSACQTNRCMPKIEPSLSKTTFLSKKIY